MNATIQMLVDMELFVITCLEHILVNALRVPSQILIQRPNVLQLLLAMWTMTALETLFVMDTKDACVLNLILEMIADVSKI